MVFFIDDNAAGGIKRTAPPPVFASRLAISLIFLFLMAVIVMAVLYLERHW
jgi:hypothetical protein